MASSTTARQLARIGAVVVGGGITTWWLRGEEDESSNGNLDDDSTHSLSRHRLVDHLHVTLTTPTPAALPLSLPAWLLPSLSSALPPQGQGPEEREAEQDQQQSEHHRPPPILFLSCADPFVIENLVQDVFEKRYVQRGHGQALKGGCLLIVTGENGERKDAPLFRAFPSHYCPGCCSVCQGIDI